MIKTLFLTRNGVLEPLGQSQVLGYLRGLSQEYQITLISYEKDADWRDSQRMEEMRSTCEALGIRWLPQRFKSSPRIIAPAIAIVRLIGMLRREIRDYNVRLVHARSYVPAAVALVVSKLTGVPFIFDMRGFWPEEMITARRLRRGSWLHRCILVAEKACLRNASAVVSLTHAGADHLRKVYPDEICHQRISVIPTCADLDLFSPSITTVRRHAIGCLGTILSGWFRIDWLAAFLEFAAHKDSNITFELTTRDNPEAVRTAIGGDIMLQSRIAILASSSDKVAEILHGQIASVMFYAGGEVSELGRSPTRMAEVLGCGMPVVANAGVGDVARIINKYNVGVIATGKSVAEMEKTWDSLQILLRDPELGARCRNAAEVEFSLASGTRAFSQIYSEIVGK